MSKIQLKISKQRRIHRETIITTANGLFEGFKVKSKQARRKKSVTNLKRKISVKIFKQNYGVLICKYDLQMHKQKNVYEGNSKKIIRRSRTEEK